MTIQKYVLRSKFGNLTVRLLQFISGARYTAIDEWEFEILPQGLFKTQKPKTRHSFVPFSDSWAILVQYETHQNHNIGTTNIYHPLTGSRFWSYGNIVVSHIYLPVCLCIYTDLRGPMSGHYLKSTENTRVQE